MVIALVPQAIIEGAFLGSELSACTIVNFLCRETVSFDGNNTAASSGVLPTSNQSTRSPASTKNSYQ